MNPAQTELIRRSMSKEMQKLRAEAKNLRRRADLKDAEADRLRKESAKLGTPLLLQ